MNKTRIYGTFLTLAIAVPLSAFAIVRYIESNVADLPYYAADFSAIAKENANTVEPFRFVNQTGDTLTGDFVRGKVWIACYFFTTCPGICPMMVDGMRTIQEELPQDGLLRMVSFTVNPEVDTPEVLKQYADNRNINTDQWNFVTGEKKALYRYARKVLNLTATDGDGGSQDFIHSDRLVLIDQENYIRGYYDGTEASEVRQLVTDIRKLLK